MRQNENSLVFRPRESNLNKNLLDFYKKNISREEKIETSPSFFNHLLEALRRNELFQKLFTPQRDRPELTERIISQELPRAIRQLPLLLQSCSLDADFYSKSQMRAMTSNDQIHLVDFLLATHTVLRLFDSYKAISEDNSFDRLREKFGKNIETVLTNNRGRNPGHVIETMFSKLFNKEITDTVQLMIQKLPMRARRQMFVLLHSIHQTLEFRPLERWFQVVKSVGDKNPTNLSVDPHNFSSEILFSQSEKDHDLYSAQGKALIVNNFLLFEPYETPTCLCICPAKSLNGDYFFPGMLYTMDSDTETLLGQLLNLEKKKKVVISEGVFTFVRALSTKDLEKLNIYHKIKIKYQKIF